MNLKKLINNSKKYKKEFNVWKNVNSILNQETTSEKKAGLFVTFCFFISFTLSFILNFFLIDFDHQVFFILGAFGSFSILALFIYMENLFRKIKHKNNLKKNNPYLKLFSVYKTTLMPSLEKKNIEYLKKEIDTIGFDNYLNFKKIIEDNTYNKSDFISFVNSVIQHSKKEEILKISEEELITFLEEFTPEEQEIITKNIKEKINKKDLNDNIQENLKDIRKLSMNNKIIKEI